MLSIKKIILSFSFSSSSSLSFFSIFNCSFMTSLCFQMSLFVFYSIFESLITTRSSMSTKRLCLINFLICLIWVFSSLRAMTFFASISSLFICHNCIKLLCFFFFSISVFFRCFSFNIRSAFSLIRSSSLSIKKMTFNRLREMTFCTKLSCQHFWWRDSLKSLKVDSTTMNLVQFMNWFNSSSRIKSLHCVWFWIFDIYSNRSSSTSSIVLERIWDRDKIERDVDRDNSFFRLEIFSSFIFLLRENCRSCWMQLFSLINHMWNFSKANWIVLLLKMCHETNISFFSFWRCLNLLLFFIFSFAFYSYFYHSPR